MRVNTITILGGVALLAGQATASAVIVSRTLHALLRRQAIDPSEVPAQCQSLCKTIVNAANTCSAISCLCNETVSKSFQACLECGLSISGDAASMASAQTSVDQYLDSCAEAGAPLSSWILTLGSSTAVATSSPTLTGVGVTVTGTNPASGPVTNPVGTSVPTTGGNAGTTSSAASDPLGTSNPLSGNGATKSNGASVLAVSSAAMGLVGVAVAVLAL